MILEVVQSKWSLTWYDPLGPRICVLELMNGHVLQTLREQLKVPGSRLEGSLLLLQAKFPLSELIFPSCPTLTNVNFQLTYNFAFRYSILFQ